MTVQKPPRWRAAITPALAALPAALPFVVLIAAYWVASDLRLAANPRDKLMPSFATMATSFWHLSVSLDAHTGRPVLFDDWTTSVLRITTGSLGAAATALVVGMATGTSGTLRRIFRPMITFLSIIPPLALLPILFVTLGTAEVGKDGLIYLGVVWTMAREIDRCTAAIAGPAWIKARTLGSDRWQFIRFVILPQTLPRLLTSLRQHLPAAWLFLIAAEAISSESGLGYRIFLVRRYMAMDLIIPYAIVITFTGYAADRALAGLGRRLFPWDHAEENRP